MPKSTTGKIVTMLSIIAGTLTLAFGGLSVFATKDEVKVLRQGMREDVKIIKQEVREIYLVLMKDHCSN